MTVGAGYFAAAGSGDALVVVEPGAVIQEISCVAGVGAATIAIVRSYSGRQQALPTIPVAAGEAFETRPLTLRGPCSVEFAGTARYFVSWGS